MLTLRLGSGKATQDGAVPTRIADRYEIIGELGKGGMGTVYRVRHVHTGEHLALKLLRVDAAQNPELVSRFKREMRASAVLRSEHVARVTDADTTGEDGLLYLVMELLEGCDLYRLLQSGPPLSKEDAVWVLGQMAKALTKAHQAGIVHRDLKPENIFFHRTETGLLVKLLDFGIAYFRDASAENSGSRVTQSHSTLGTPQYMAPEQVLAEHDKISTGTDIWAIGMLAYEQLSGKPFFAELGLRQIIGKMTGGTMPIPSEKLPSLPAAFDAWFARSCAPEPGLRFATVNEQLEALTEALGVPVSVLHAAAPSAGLRARLYSLSPSKSDSGRAATIDSALIASVDVAVQQAKTARRRKWLVAALLLLLFPAGWLALRHYGREQGPVTATIPPTTTPSVAKVIATAKAPPTVSPAPPATFEKPAPPAVALPSPPTETGSQKAAAAAGDRKRPRKTPTQPETAPPVPVVVEVPVPKDYNPVAP